MCMYCKEKKTVPSVTSHVVDYHGRLIIVKNVPCEECVRCGEKYYSETVARKLEEIIDSAKKVIQEISVMEYSEVA